MRKCNHLIMADPGFIVYLTDELDICWQTTAEWDEKIHLTQPATGLSSTKWPNSNPQSGTILMKGVPRITKDS